MRIWETTGAIGSSTFPALWDHSGTEVPLPDGPTMTFPITSLADWEEQL
jgi:hypothetical protein